MNGKRMDKVAFENIREWLQENEVARKLATLVSYPTYRGIGFAIDIAEALGQLFPEKFPPKADKELLALGLSDLFDQTLSPLEAPPPETLIPSDLPETVQQQLEPALYTIIQAYYMPWFNRDPRGTLKRLESLSDDERSFVANLIKRVKEYYQELFDLEIPGVGKPSDYY